MQTKAITGTSHARTCLTFGFIRWQVGMQHDPDNLFLRLSKWATRQGENFLTEALVVVLQSLVKRDPEVASRVFREMTDGFLVLDKQEVLNLSVETQSTLASGRPDLVLRISDSLVYVEAKDYAGLGERQLERYLEELQRSGVPRVRLVLLSRYFVEHALLPADVVLRRWFHMGEYLESELTAGLIVHSEARFLVESFVAFLQAKGLVMERIDRIDRDSVLSLRSLCVMIEESLAALRLQRRRVADWTWMGLYLEDSQFGVGVRFENPEMIEFMTAQFPVSPEAGLTASEGTLVESEFPTWTKGPYRWINTLDLSVDSGEFFSLPKALQMTQIEEFILRSRQIAISLRSPK